jgi:DNA-binding MurR/RpiR family transcriptional regulator
MSYKRSGAAKRVDSHGASTRSSREEKTPVSGAVDRRPSDMSKEARVIVGEGKLTVEQLLQRFSEEYEGLSKQLKIIARHIERNRDHLGLEGIRELAQHCEVQPSAVVRFAKHFGLSGFAEMQRIFRDGLAQYLEQSRSYETRIRKGIESGVGRLSSSEITDEFLRGNISGMQELRERLHGPRFDKAVNLLAETDAISICGSRRSFPVAVYLEYALQHTDKRITLISAMGGMQQGQVRSVRRGDVMVAISYTPYAQETIEVAQEVLTRGARLIAITDSRMSPLARGADVALIVQDHSTLGFRSLSSTMSLAESLFIALAYRLELSHSPVRRDVGARIR